MVGRCWLALVEMPPEEALAAPRCRSHRAEGRLRALPQAGSHHRPSGWWQMVTGPSRSRHQHQAWVHLAHPGRTWQSAKALFPQTSGVVLCRLLRGEAQGSTWSPGECGWLRWMSSGQMSMFHLVAGVRLHLPEWILMKWKGG